ncbi:MAG TPA: MFS transporter [Clostridiales bacterium]|nr:MFS transporter [Clostridiales bacterium]
MKQETRMKVAALAATSFIMVLVNNALFPVFPQMAKALNINLKSLSLLVAAVSFPAAVLSPFGGVLADRWSKKLIMVISVFIFGLGGLLAGLAKFIFDKPFTVILIGRFIQGIGLSTPIYLSMALAGDIFQSDERHKVVGILEAANGGGKLLSPVIGSVVGLIGWYAPFFIYPAVSIPVALAILFTIKEPKQQPIQWDRQKKAFASFKNSSRIIALVASFATLFVLTGTLFWLSDFLEEKFKDGRVIRGFILALPILGMSFTAMFARFFGKRLGPRLTMGFGSFIMAGGMVSIPYTYNTVIFWPLLIVIGVGAGMILPSIDAVSTGVKKREYRGVLATCYGSSRSFGSATAPYIFAVLMDMGKFKETFFPVSIGIAVVGLVLILFIKDKDLLPESLLPQR